jgi:hypothetical protein
MFQIVVQNHFALFVIVVDVVHVQVDDSVGIFYFILYYEISFLNYNKKKSPREKKLSYTFSFSFVLYSISSFKRSNLSVVRCII